MTASQAIYTQSLTDQLVVEGHRVPTFDGRSQQFIDFEELDANLFQVPGAYHDQQSSGEAQLTFKNDRWSLRSADCSTWTAPHAARTTPRSVR